jgi:DNA-binding response OmpR family regulator
MPEKILVVDDDPETVRLLQLFLQRLGYTTLGATDGVQAIELARRECPDLIILDIMMPGMDGFEVARSLDRLPETTQIPILMVTARASVEDKSRGYEAGADIYLTKPVHQMDLQATIKALLHQRKERKEAAAVNGFHVGVIAAKGGLGVSTVTINLAVSYARKFGAKVIAAELRPGQGTWSDELNLPLNTELGDLLKMDPSRITADEVEKHLSKTSFGLRLLLASNFHVHPTFHSDSAQYRALISALGSLAPVTFLDIGTYFSEAVIAILELCSEVIVVTEPQSLAVKQTGRLIERLRGLNFGTTRPITLVSLNHTRADSTMPVSQIEATLQRPVALGIPPAMELASAAVRQNLPMTVAQPDNLVALQYTKLAELINKHVERV